MSRKFIYTLIVISLGIWLLGAARTLAWMPQPTAADRTPNYFWHAQTLGDPNAPYLADSEHLYLPNGMAVDTAGNLWVTEAMGNRVLKYDLDGAFLMSIGVAGVLEVADETHLVSPNDVVIDGNGDFWVADFGAQRVTKYNPAGVYLTQLGVTWQAGTDNAHFNGPVGVALDSAGNLYVSDIDNHRIQVFDSDAYYLATIGVTGVSGSDNAHFNLPIRIAIDQDDNLYVPDALNHRVQVFDSTHAYLATLGVTGVPGDDNDHFDIPRGVAVDADFIYVADGGNHRVQIFDRTTRAYVETLGSWGIGNYEFNITVDVATDADGNLYVGDVLNHRVQMYDSNLAYVRTYGETGVPYVTNGYHYNSPYDVAVSSAGNIAIVEDWGRGQRLIALDADGEPLFIVGEPQVSGDDDEHFADPKGVAFDASGRLYVADCANHRVQIFDGAGVWIARIGTGWGMGNYEFDCPAGVTVDADGKIYVADGNNHRVQIYNSSRIYVDTLGTTGESGSDNAHFNGPSDVAVDADGNIYVADLFNHRVQKFDSSLAWQMTLGVSGVCGTDASHFCEPYGVAVDQAGGVYVVDKFSPLVRVFDSSGAFRTMFGGWGFADGQFRYPSGVDVDADGNVYVADLYNHRIQIFAPGARVFLPLTRR